MASTAYLRMPGGPAWTLTAAGLRCRCLHIGWAVSMFILGVHTLAACLRRGWPASRVGCKHVYIRCAYHNCMPSTYVTLHMGWAVSMFICVHTITVYLQRMWPTHGVGRDHVIMFTYPSRMPSTYVTVHIGWAVSMLMCVNTLAACLWRGWPASRVGRKHVYIRCAYPSRMPLM
jgi:hydrogenase maturation factor